MKRCNAKTDNNHKCKRKVKNGKCWQHTTIKTRSKKMRGGAKLEGITTNGKQVELQTCRAMNNGPVSYGRSEAERLAVRKALENAEKKYGAIPTAAPPQQIYTQPQPQSQYGPGPPEINMDTTS
jgi:hypothetical protein